MTETETNENKSDLSNLQEEYEYGYEDQRRKDDSKTQEIEETTTNGIIKNIISQTQSDFTNSLQNEIMPYVCELEQDIEALQYMSEEITRNTEEERNQINNNLERMINLINEFQVHITQYLPELKITQNQQQTNSNE